MQAGVSEPYAELVQRAFAGWEQSIEVTHSIGVTEAIWRAANDPSSPIRIAAGADSVALMSNA
jgi:hypothetical protein